MIQDAVLPEKHATAHHALGNDNSLFQTLMGQFVEGLFNTAGGDCFNLIWNSLIGSGGDPAVALLQQISTQITKLSTQIQGIPAQCNYIIDYNNINVNLINLQSHLNTPMSSLDTQDWTSIINFLSRADNLGNGDYFTYMNKLMNDVYGFNLNLCFTPGNPPLSQQYGSNATSIAYITDQNLIGNNCSQPLYTYVSAHMQLSFSMAAMASLIGQTAAQCYTLLSQADAAGYFSANGNFSQLGNLVNGQTGILSSAQIQSDLANTNSTTFFPTVIFPYLKVAPLTLCQQAFVVFLELSQGQNAPVSLCCGASANYNLMSTNQKSSMVISNSNVTGYNLGYQSSQTYSWGLTLQGNISNSTVAITAPYNGYLGIVEVYVGGMSAPWELLNVGVAYGLSSGDCLWTVMVSHPSWASQPVFAFCNQGNKKGSYMSNSTSGGTAFPSFSSSNSPAGTSEAWILSAQNYNSTINNI